MFRPGQFKLLNSTGSDYGLTRPSSINNVSKVLVDNVRRQQTPTQPIIVAKPKKVEPSPYQLMPLGIALHHLTDSEELEQLYDGIRSKCLKEINSMIQQIEAHILHLTVCDC